ncbi:multidrug effflux MFS transporter [Algihabitans albus]|uniref:multidrug effflux MFS transporter n=1 Tax=Algihabitans albus TaxID=2164067 RepID=UPI0035CEE58E
MPRDEAALARAAGGASHPKPSLLILVAVSAIGPLALNLFVPSMPGLQAAFGIPYATAQLTLTLYLIGLAAAQLIYGPLSDRFGRRPTLIAGLWLFVAGSLAAAVAPSIELLIAARMAQALGGAAGIVLARAIVRDLYGREKAASMIGYITMAWVLAPMIAPVVGGLLDQAFDWRAGFWLLAAAGVAVVLSCHVYLHETHHDRSLGGGWRGLLEGYRWLLRRPRFNAYALTTGFTSSVFFSFLAGAPYVMVEVLGRSPVEYGLWFILSSLGYMTGNGLAGRFSERLGVERMIALGTILAFLGAATALGLFLAGALAPWALFVPMLLVAVGNGLAIPNGIAGAVSVNPRLAGTAAGLAGFLQLGLGAATSQSVGLLQGIEPYAVVYVMTAGALIAVLVHQVAIRFWREADRACPSDSTTSGGRR